MFVTRTSYTFTAYAFLKVDACTVQLEPDLRLYCPVGHSTCACHSTPMLVAYGRIDAWFLYASGKSLRYSPARVWSRLHGVGVV
jgi:hypothetical protein